MVFDDNLFAKFNCNSDFDSSKSKIVLLFFAIFRRCLHSLNYSGSLYFLDSEVQSFGKHPL